MYESLMPVIARICLSFSNEAIPILIVIGLMRKNRQLFIKATYLLFFSMMLNCLLKSLFRVPLNPGLGLEGYAFPSGHMQASIAFYFYLLCSFSHRFIRFLLVLVNLATWFGLDYFGYHDSLDVLGGVVIGIASALLYLKIQPRFTLQNMGWLLLCGNSIILALLYLLGGIKSNTWVAYMGTMIFAGTIYLRGSKDCREKDGKVDYQSSNG